MKRALIAGVALLAMGVLVAFGADTSTITELTSASVKSVEWSWAGGSGGIVDDTTTAALDGELIGFCVEPDTTSGIIPLDNFDVVLYDSRGIDLLVGGGANLDSASVTYFTWLGDEMLPASNTPLRLYVSGVDSADAGVCTAWIR